MINSMTTGEGIIYGLGVVVARSKWGRTYGHDGEFPGYLSEIRYYTKHKLAISLLINSEETPEASQVLTSAVDDFAEVIVQATTPLPTVSIDRDQLQKLAESWLSLVDAGDFEKAWNQMSDRLKMRVPKNMWETMIRNSQRENGKLKSRKLVAISSPSPERKLLAIQFDTEFLKRPSGTTESVVLELEDGEWRITSYSIR
jgi:hypothetical protein